MAPKFPGIFIDPLDPADFTGGGPDQTPSFTQDVMDIIGNAGDPTDGFDELLSGAGTLVDLWDSATAAQDAELDTILAGLEASNPAPLDKSMEGYVGSFETGRQVLSDVGNLAPQDIGLFPINTNFQNGVPVAPIEQSIDLGKVKINSALIRHEIGRGQYVDQTYTGIQQPSLVSGEAVYWYVDFDERDSPNGNENLTYYVAFNPLALGTFVARVIWYTYAGDYQQVDLTLTVTVIP